MCTHMHTHVRAHTPTPTPTAPYLRSTMNSSSTTPSWLFTASMSYISTAISFFTSASPASCSARGTRSTSSQCPRALALRVPVSLPRVYYNQYTTWEVETLPLREMVLYTCTCSSIETINSKHAPRHIWCALLRKKELHILLVLYTSIIYSAVCMCLNSRVRMHTYTHTHAPVCLPH